MKETAPYSKDVYLAVHESTFSRLAARGLSEESLAELQEMVDKQRLKPLRRRKEEDPEDTPAAKPPLRKGGGDWKNQPKERLVLGERERLQRRIEQSGLHRAAQQIGVAHATLTRAVRGEAIVQEKISTIRAGLRRDAIPRPPKQPRKKPTGEVLGLAERRALAALVKEAAALSALKRGCSLSEASLTHAAKGGVLTKPNLRKIRGALALLEA